MLGFLILLECASPRGAHSIEKGAKLLMPQHRARYRPIGPEQRFSSVRQLMPVLCKLEKFWELVDPNSQAAAARTGGAL